MGIIWFVLFIANLSSQSSWSKKIELKMDGFKLGFEHNS